MSTMLNNKRCRALAEEIIDLIASHDMFCDGVCLMVNRTRLSSPESGNADSAPKVTKGKTRYAVTKTPYYAKGYMADPSAPLQVVVLTFDGALYDAVNEDPDFAARFLTALNRICSEFGCAWRQPAPNRITIHPDDPASAAPFARRNP